MQTTTLRLFLLLALLLALAAPAGAADTLTMTPANDRTVIFTPTGAASVDYTTMNAAGNPNPPGNLVPMAGGFFLNTNPADVGLSITNPEVAAHDIVGKVYGLALVANSFANSNNYTLGINLGTGGMTYHAVNNNINPDFIGGLTYSALYSSYRGDNNSRRMDINYTGGAISLNVSREFLLGVGALNLETHIIGAGSAAGDISLNSAPVTLGGGVALATDEYANSAGFSAGVYAANGSVNAAGQITLNNIARSAIVSPGQADASGFNYGVYAGSRLNAGVWTVNHASAGAVTLSNLSYIASGGSNFPGFPGANAIGDSYGVYAANGNASASGPVVLESITRSASSSAGGADAFGDNYGVFAGDKGNASAGAVTLKNLSASAASVGDANAYGRSAGVYAVSGKASASGPVVLENLTRSASGNAGKANAIGQSFGVYAGAVPLPGGGLGGGNAKAERVSLVNLASVARGTGPASNKLVAAYSLGLGVGSVVGHASADGSVMVERLNASAEHAGSGPSLARAEAIGLSAGKTATLNGDVSVSASADAAGGQAFNYSRALGAEALESIVLSGNRAITAQAGSYAHALATTDHLLFTIDAGPVGADTSATPHTTTLNGAARLRGQAADLNNNHTINPFDADQTSGFFFNPAHGLPVSASEYLGLGKADTLNFNLGAGQVMDNAGKPLRVFGAETVNLNSGALALAGGSYFINQKGFNNIVEFTQDAAAGKLSVTPGTEYGLVNGPPRATQLNINSDAALRLDGALAHSIDAAGGAHQSLFSTNKAFTLGTDYQLNVNLKSGGSLVVGSAGAMSMSAFEQDKGGLLQYVLAVQDSALKLGQLTVQGKAALAGQVKLDRSSVKSLPGDGGYTATVLTASNLDAASAVLEKATALFYSYGFQVNGNNLELKFSRSSIGNLLDLVKQGGGSWNTEQLAKALVVLDKEGRLPSVFSDLFWKADNATELVYMLNQLHAETISSAYYGMMRAQNMNFYMLDLMNRYPELASFGLSYSGQPGAANYAAYNQLNQLARNQQDDFESGVPLFLAAGEPLGMNQGFDANNPWRLRFMVNGGAGKMSGHDNMFGYDMRNFSGILAIERVLNENFTLGLAGSLGRAQLEFDNYGNDAHSTDYGVNLYGRYNVDDLFFSARVGYARSDADLTRNLPSFGVSAQSDPTADYFSAGLMSGYRFRPGDSSWEITPAAGLNWLHASFGAVDERGAGAYNLHYDSSGMDSVEVSLNAGVRKFIPAGEASLFIPRLNLGLGYELADTNVESQTTFSELAGFPHFGVRSPDVGRLRFMAGAGVDFYMTKNFGLALDYRGSFQRDYQEHLGQLSVKFSW